MTAPLVTDVPHARGRPPATRPAERALSRLIAGLGGRVVLPGSPAWDRARRSWNLGYDPQPLAVIRAADARDVAATVRYAREHEVPLTIRSGGHSLAGHSGADGALLLDLGDLRSLDIDPATRVAVAGPGLRAGEYSAAAVGHGLGTSFGDTGGVGLGGLVTGGGIGWLTRAYGMTIDSLVAADVVTADGELRTVDAEHEPELFWGLRGGGGNLGVVTRLRLRLHPVDRFLGGAIALPATVDVVRQVLEVADAAPDGLTLIPTLMRIPPLPFVPAEHHGTPSMVVLAAWVGDPEAGQRALAPIRAISPAMGDMVAPMPYPAIYSLTEEAGKPTVDASRSAFVDGLDDSAVAGLIEGLEASTAEMTLIQLRVLGGAMARVPADATAFAHRAARIMMVAIATTSDASRQPVNEAWAVRMLGLVAGRATGVYVNLLNREGPDRVRAAYPGPTWDRLVALKRRWDPTNLFRFNQNVAP
ncbi:MAG: FAD-binding protein [Chloroflexota bacterium]